MADDPADRLAAMLLTGVAHLRGGRPSEAVEVLRAFCADPQLEGAEDLDDVRARAHSLLAQGLLELGRPGEAQAEVDIALGLADAEGDQDGVVLLTDLARRIAEATPPPEPPVVDLERATRLADLTLDEIETRVRDPKGRAELLVRKANAEVDVGRPEAGQQVARHALAAATDLEDPRLQVLARLSIARADPDRATEELSAALATADAANEPNLVTAVVKSARLHGIVLPKTPGPGDPR